MNLRLLQLGDSALPIGGYSHSWGLEAAVDRGLVRDAAGLEQWVRDWLRFVVVPGEGVLVAAGCAAAARGDWASLRHANELFEAGLSPPTLRQASREMGEQLLSLAENWPWAAGAARRLRETSARVWYHPLVFATLAAVAPATPAEALALFLNQAAMGLIAAGVKAIPIGHTHGQQLLASLHEAIEELAAEWSQRDLETAGAYCPAYEVLCHAQSRLYTRLFRS